MDIDLLAKMVKEIILDNDTVTLPGIGSFAAELIPSSFTDRGYVITPPYRRLTFTEREGTDSLLTDFYAAGNSMDKMSAAKILNDFLSEMKELLKVRKTILLPGLGKLRATRENIFFFVPDEDLDIYPAGFGLGPVSLKSHADEDGAAPSSVAYLNVPEAASAVAAEEVPKEEGQEQEQPAETEVVAVAGMSEESDAAAETDVAAETIAVAETADMAETNAAAAETAAAVETDAAAAAETADVPAENAAAAPAEEHKAVRGGGRTALKVIFIVAASLLVLAISYLVFANLAPDALDRLLYTDEELEIIERAGW